MKLFTRAADTDAEPRQHFPYHGAGVSPPPEQTTWPTGQTEAEAEGPGLIYDTADEAAAPVRPDLPPKNPAPAPVIIRPRKATGWSTWRAAMPVPAEPVQLAGQHLGRTSLIIRNVGSVELTVGPADDVTPDVHFPVAAGGQVTFDHTGPVWGVTAAGLTTAVVMLAEYDVEKGGA